MSYLIVIREYNYNDATYINQLVREVYLSTVNKSWLNIVFKEITFQLMVMSAAIMFIFLGVPLLYCLTAIPIVLLGLYLAVYASLLMKASEVTHGRGTLQTWVAEAHEPFFFAKDPQNCSYKVILESELEKEGFDVTSCQKKIVGTVSVMQHSSSGTAAWLFRLAVDKRYRKKGIGTLLVKVAQDYCRIKGFYDIQLALTENHDEARQLFINQGFQMRLMYHKQIVGRAFSLLMFHFNYNLEPEL